MEPYLQSFYTIRFSDCDPFRHLNNARYIDYFLNAREDHLKAHYQMELGAFYKEGRGWVVNQHDIVYVRPAAYNETVSICSGVLRVEPELIYLEMVMLDARERQLKALLHTRFVPVDLKTGRKQAHEPHFMDFITSKVIPLVESSNLTASSRVEHWLQTLKNIPTA